MEKVEKVFDSKWGLIIFYIVIAIVTYAISSGIARVTNTSVSHVNTISSETTYA